MNQTSPSGKRTRVLFLYNVPDWAIHNVGRDWAALLSDTHEFTLVQFGRHEHEDQDAYDHVVWGYSTLDYSGRMLLESVTRRPWAWWRWRRHAGRNFAAVVQDPSEVFPEVPDWKRSQPAATHLQRFARLAVTSNEMREALQRCGVPATQVSTHSLLPVRSSDTIVREPLRAYTRAQNYPRKNLAMFDSVQAAIRGTIERCDGLIGGAVMSQAEYVAAIDGYNTYLCTSFQEGGPLPVMDAMRRGCVVLTTRVGQTDTLIEHGVNGYFCENDSEFVARLLELAADPERLFEMRQRSLERAGRPIGASELAALRAFLP